MTETESILRDELFANARRFRIQWLEQRMALYGNGVGGDEYDSCRKERDALLDKEKNYMESLAPK